MASSPAAGGSAPVDLLNRPLLEEDLDAIDRNPVSAELRKLCKSYADRGLVVMNGGFEYCNLREGPEQLLTCGPYRLWEYSSLFLRFKAAPPCEVLDLGGAASPLPYLLAERGHRTTAVDLQPLLVEVCRAAASSRNLPLEAIQCDIATQSQAWRGRFDLVTCISVIEHIPAAPQRRIIQALFDILRPGGMLYLTFDYGAFREMEHYQEQEAVESASLEDIGELCSSLDQAGFGFIGNDPRQLPPQLLNLRSSPGHARLMQRYQLQMGGVDGNTSWKSLAGHAARRLFGLGLHSRPSRYAQHNFFRMFLEKPAAR